jgi:hypothetical protein
VAINGARSSVAQFAPSNPTGHWQVSATQVPPFWHVTAQSASSSPQLIMNAVGMMMTDKNKIMFLMAIECIDCSPALSQLFGFRCFGQT